MADDKTPHYKWPLPSAENLLSEDVGRIRDSLSSIDTALHSEATARAAAVDAESAARAAAITAEATARGQDKAALEARLKKTRTLALAGL
nr:MAG TPA: hypothetical protein [Herelleviridae sp.]